MPLPRAPHGVVDKSHDTGANTFSTPDDQGVPITRTSDANVSTINLTNPTNSAAVLVTLDNIRNTMVFIGRDGQTVKVNGNKKLFELFHNLQNPGASVVPPKGTLDLTGSDHTPSEFRG